MADAKRPKDRVHAYNAAQLTTAARMDEIPPSFGDRRPSCTQAGDQRTVTAFDALACMSSGDGKKIEAYTPECVHRLHCSTGAGKQGLYRDAPLRPKIAEDDHP